MSRHRMLFVTAVATSTVAAVCLDLLFRFSRYWPMEILVSTSFLGGFTGGWWMRSQLYPFLPRSPRLRPRGSVTEEEYTDTTTGRSDRGKVLPGKHVQ